MVCGLKPDSSGRGGHPREEVGPDADAGEVTEAPARPRAPRAHTWPRTPREAAAEEGPALRGAKHTLCTKPTSGVRTEKEGPQEEIVANPRADPRGRPPSESAPCTGAKVCAASQVGPLRASNLLTRVSRCARPWREALAEGCCSRTPQQGGKSSLGRPQV